MVAAPRRKNDPAGMRARVLDAAFELFQAQGYGSTTMQHITAAAGVTSGALHHHFPTKKALGLAVVRERVAPAVEETWIEPVRRAATAKDGVLGVFAEIAGELDARGRVQGCPLNNLAMELSLADADFRGEIRRVFDRWRAALAERLRDGGAPAAGGFAPEELAAFVIAAYSGAMALSKTEQSAAPLKAAAHILQAQLWPA